ncbi:hypothetical protein C8Q78DRAFT_393495 [Trametes maxima]|nr:hypothetical protein C8Q78DRAFT_393495 [Trametes maxima]
MLSSHLSLAGSLVVSTLCFSSARPSSAFLSRSGAAKTISYAILSPSRPWPTVSSGATPLFALVPLVHRYVPAETLVSYLGPSDVPSGPPCLSMLPHLPPWSIMHSAPHEETTAYVPRSHS